MRSSARGIKSISIHSLRVEGDVDSRETLCLYRNFNPLPPRGGRPVDSLPSLHRMLFQSTPSAWRETMDSPGVYQHIRNFNPLPPRGGRRNPVR